VNSSATGALDEQELERRAALAAEAERARDRFAHRDVEVRVGEDDAWVLRAETEHAPQPMRRRVACLLG
jgi:hypothetical protein